MSDFVQGIQVTGVQSQKPAESLLQLFLFGFFSLLY